MKPFGRAMIPILALSCSALPAFGDEPELSAEDLPRIPPTEPDQALATFQIKKGFRIELVAAEPLVVDPIAMSFDEDGRLFVVEMRDYSERRPERLGRIRLLKDTDGDGHFDKSTVYVDQLPWPTAVFCHGGGVFVGATPDILFCKDTNGDGIADVKEVVFTGFASDYAPFQTNRLNVQALLNSFNWGLDNRIHGSASKSGGKVQLEDGPFVREWLERAGIKPKADSQKPKFLDLRGRDFSFDPRTLDLRAESGGAQHGMSFDSRGRKFVCSNSDHIQLVMYEDGYASRNAFYSMPPARASIAADGPAAEVFRISPDEPWRVIRTQWRVAGLVPGPIEGGGRPSGYFTGATGTTIYRGDAFPEEYRESAFIADCGSNLVHRKKLYPDGTGVGLRAERPADEQRVEFLASTDNWFRPVQFANAPDGCLYIADMYREVIEHPWSLPGSIKKHLDLNSGNDRGRIYRITPEGFRQPNAPRLGSMTGAELVRLLEHSNGWHRDAAARLLYERQDRSVASALIQLLTRARLAHARLHALYVLDGLDALEPKHLLRAFDDINDEVREHAVRLAEKCGRRRSAALQTLEGTASSMPAHTRVEDSFPTRLLKKLHSMAGDPSPRVRYQLAFTLGGFDDRERIKPLERIIRRDADDRWVRAAVLSSLTDDAGRMFEQIIDREWSRASGGGFEFVRSLVRMIGARNRSNEVASVLERLAGIQSPKAAFPVATSLGQGLEDAGCTLAQADIEGRLGPLYAAAKSWALAEPASPDSPVSVDPKEAIEFLGKGPFSNAAPTLRAVLTNTAGAQPAAIQALVGFKEPVAGEILLESWSYLTPDLRPRMVDAMMRRTERVSLLLAAIEAGEIRPHDLNPSQTDTLRKHRDLMIRERASKLLAQPETTREDLVRSFLPSLQMRGDPGKGKQIYLDRCASCHRIGSQGHALGPDLMSVKTAGKEKLLVNILDPNREVAPNYVSYSVETKSGESLTGLMVVETANSVSLHGPNGVETLVLRSQIGRLQSSGRSLMPEGLEAGLTPQDMADLIDYLGVGDE